LQIQTVPGGIELSTGREEHMAHTRGGQEFMHESELFHIIEDQEPVWVLLEPALYSRKDLVVLTFLLFWQIEGLHQRSQISE
jgi:hypothetical protein